MKKNRPGRRRADREVSLIIPAFNEEGVIAEMLETLSRVLLARKIIVVNDGSSGSTAERVREFIARTKATRVRLIETLSAQVKKSSRDSQI